MSDLETPSHADGIDPRRVPTRRLSSGACMPGIGFGTFGSDQVSAEEIATAVEGAIQGGYRHIDCASIYGNEKEIGASLQSVLSAGVPRPAVSRDDLWITSKVWNDMHGRVVESCRQTLADLRLNYLDLYLVHWPFPNYHSPGCSVDERNPNARPYIHAEYMATWRAMESLVDLGLVRHIGTSNMTVAKLELLLRDARIQPVVNEMELHPHFQQPEFFSYVRAHGIEPVGFCPIGSPARPARDRTPEDTVDIEDPVLIEIARRRNVHPATMCIHWAVQRGQTPIPMATDPRFYMANLAAAVAEPLSGEEMNAIAAIDRDCRLIKGQVFLWRDGQSWRDLWDEDGIIAGW